MALVFVLIYVMKEYTIDNINDRNRIVRLFSRKIIWWHLKEELKQKPFRNKFKQTHLYTYWSTVKIKDNNCK